MHSSSLQVEACSSLQRCFVTEWFQLSQAGWEGAPFPPSDTRQLWLSMGQGMEQPRESCSEQAPLQSRAATTPPFLRPCGRLCMLLKTQTSSRIHTQMCVCAGTGAQGHAGDLCRALRVWRQSWVDIWTLGSASDTGAFAALGVRLLSCKR